MSKHSKFSLSLAATGAFSLAIAVAAGAIGTHALKSRLTAAQLATFDTAQTYHVIHSFGLIILALLVFSFGMTKLRRIVAWLFGIGLVLFSGSLYFVAISGDKTLVFLPPFGGFGWILAWVILGISLAREGCSVTPNSIPSS